MQTLSDLIFSDLFVTESPQTSWFKDTPDSLRTQVIPAALHDEIIQLRKKLEECEREDFRVSWPNEVGFRLRVGKMVAADNHVIYICRRFRVLAGPLTHLGVPDNIAAKLMQTDLREGLVILLGKTGSGKTTTAASFVRERLATYGGVCWTIENPIELNLQGQHGNGICYQTEIQSDEMIADSMRHIYRASPNMIFIGELRTPSAVREAILAGGSGHLVVATFHAADLVTGLARLARMAGDDTANAALSDVLRVAMHVSLHNAENRGLPGLSGLVNPASKGTGTPPRVLSVEPLWINEKTQDALKSIIRNGDFSMLSSEIKRQRDALLMSKLP